MIRNAQGAQAQAPGPALIEAEGNEIVYELTFDLPDAGLAGTDTEHMSDMGDSRRDDTSAVMMSANTEADGRRYPTRARRSAIGNQPYDQFAPRVSFLQLGEVRAHRSVLEANHMARMTEKERMLATTFSNHTVPVVDDTVHRIDSALTTMSEDELKVWGYLMTQYNLKPGLRKFGLRGQAAAVKELTQLHIMDTWMPLQAEKLFREQ